MDIPSGSQEGKIQTPVNETLLLIESSKNRYYGLKELLLDMVFNPQLYPKGDRELNPAMLFKEVRGEVLFLLDRSEKLMTNTEDRQVNRGLYKYFIETGGEEDIAIVENKLKEFEELITPYIDSSLRTEKIDVMLDAGDLEYYSKSKKNTHNNTIHI